jgi:hypothetical protein
VASKGRMAINRVRRAKAGKSIETKSRMARNRKRSNVTEVPDGK